ncbi:MAG: QueG-associated DUF1730 domain-containing protein, partial [Acidobacteriaceae bacterium]
LAQHAARGVGFDLCGVVSYPFPEVEHFERWIESGAHGDMHYLTARSDRGELKRKQLESALPWARSVVVCAINYNPDAPYSTGSNANNAWIARYALGGKDYHDTLMSRLRTVESQLRSRFHSRPEALQSRCYVDTGPIVERSLAQAAGIGWIGKNTCLINERERLGSWLFLGVIATSYELAEERGESASMTGSPPVSGPGSQTSSGGISEAFHGQFLAPDRCGTCTRCLDACPTDALVAPYQMDARRCISYLTIEKRGSIDPELRPLMGNNVFGFDICQDVCPWNRQDGEQGRAPVSGAAEFQLRPEFSAANLELAQLASLTLEQWRELFRGTPIKRAKYQGFLRNVCVAIGNSGDPNHLPRMRELAAVADPIVAEHAQWAIARLTASEPPP